MVNRQILSCRRCGRSIVAGLEALAATCSQCLTAPRVTGKAAPILPAAAPALHAAVKATCTNATSDGDCLLREDGCAVLRRQRCTHFETLLGIAPAETRALYAALHAGEVPARGPSFRTCLACGGALRTRRRFCDRCRDGRRKEAQRRRRASRATVVEKNTPISSEKQGCFLAQNQFFDPG